MDAADRVTVNALDRSRYGAGPENRPLGWVSTEMDISYYECAVAHPCGARTAGSPFALTRTLVHIVTAVTDLAYTSITAVGSSVASGVTCCKCEPVNDYTKKQWKHCGTTVGETLCIPVTVVCCPFFACGLTCCAPELAPNILAQITAIRDGTAVVIPPRQVMREAMDQARQVIAEAEKN